MIFRVSVPLADIVLFSICYSKSFLSNLLMAAGVPRKSAATSAIFWLRSGREGDLKMLPPAFPHEDASRLTTIGSRLPIT